MTDLSFLPRDLIRRRRPPVPRPARVLAVAGVTAGLAAGAAYYAVLLAGYFAARAELAALEAELRQLRPVLDLQRRLREAERLLAQQEELVRPYSGGVRMGQALEALNASVPDGVVLDGFTVDAQRQVEISGVAASLGDVARLMVALEASGRYASLRAAFPEPFAAGGDARDAAAQRLGLAPGVRFQIHGRLAAGP